MINKENCKNLIESEIYRDILSGKDATYLIEKHILHNVPFFFKDNMDSYFAIKKQISDKYKIPITNIYLVGSGQLGFSLNPKNKYRDFVEVENEEFKKRSDLDFAIISDKLFNQIWDQICGYRLNDFSYRDDDKYDYNEFQKYLFSGWMRPDKFPFEFEMRKEWFAFFNSMNHLVKRQVNCGVFRNEVSFLKQYTRSINDLKRLIETEKFT